jgi:hypothetical protein
VVIGNFVYRASGFVKTIAFGIYRGNIFGAEWLLHIASCWSEDPAFGGDRSECVATSAAGQVSGAINQTPFCAATFHPFLDCDVLKKLHFYSPFIKEMLFLLFLI